MLPASQRQSSANGRVRAGCEPAGLIPDAMPTIRNIRLKDVSVVDATFAFNLQALPEMPNGGIT